MESIGLRLFLPLYLVVYLGLAMLWSSYRVWKATGLNPYKLGRSASVHDFKGRCLAVVFAAAVGAVLLYAVWPRAYAWLLVPALPQHPVIVGVGVALLLASLAWTLVAQIQMGNSWRIGIDTETKTELVQHGVFRLSRNPIFLGMRVTILGLFLALPNVMTLLVLALGELGIQVQVRLEEEHLRRMHGEAYEQYVRRTRRWL
ncbi:MAG: isoprenylcysteine carboxylmethyltransferase family protein [Candidatus Hydrogenedentes bacterium]|nr:isoprenylcysteine carboxylmethyltransferase family protein [Candidatus Hydrogenedentota bacterium]